MRESYRQRRDAVSVELRAAGILACEPRGTFYALIDTSAIGADSYDVARRLLRDYGVAVAPGQTFGPNGAGISRISLATGSKELLDGVGRIVAAVNDANAKQGGLEKWIATQSSGMVTSPRSRRRSGRKASSISTDGPSSWSGP